MELECQRWGSKGINIKYEIRDNRNGYKAGALKEGMKHSYVKQCDYVAIFDADFQPEPDFLWRAVPFLLHNPDIALVQARWKFGICFFTKYLVLFMNECQIYWSNYTQLLQKDLGIGGLMIIFFWPIWPIFSPCFK